jgi:hypothetical protein
MFVVRWQQNVIELHWVDNIQQEEFHVVHVVEHTIQLNEKELDNQQ